MLIFFLFMEDLRNTHPKFRKIAQSMADFLLILEDKFYILIRLSFRISLHTWRTFIFFLINWMILDIVWLLFDFRLMDCLGLEPSPDKRFRLHLINFWTRWFQVFDLIYIQKRFGGIPWNLQRILMGLIIRPSCNMISNV